MAKKTSTGGEQAQDAPATSVEGPQTGRRLYPKGYGALKGQYVARPGMDLTKPIAEQAARLDREEGRGDPFFGPGEAPPER